MADIKITPQAPLLLSDVPKSDYNEQFYYQISPLMFQKINEKIDGKSGNVKILMIYLISQQQNSNFRLATETVCRACGMAQQRYSEARKKLHDLGLITYDKDEKTITINYKNLMA